MVPPAVAAVCAPAITSARAYDSAQTGPGAAHKLGGSDIPVETVMSKGQRGNKEAKKPKKARPVTVPAGPAPVVAPVNAGAGEPRKK